MPEPGWYPDPEGRPAAYRWWDGAGWSERTQTDPAAPAPSPGAGPEPGPPRRAWSPRRAALALAAGGLVAALGVPALVALRPGPREDARRPSATASASSTAVRSAPARPVGACASGDPLRRRPHPSDGRVHGGGLSYAPPTGWHPARRTVPLDWGTDVAATEGTVDRTWWALYAVGSVATDDGFTEPRRAAELAVGCTVGSTFYPGLVRRSDVFSRATTVAGRPAWSLRAAVLVDETEPVTNNLVQVTVVDLGEPGRLAFFWGSAPVADAALVAQLDHVVRGLRAG